MPNILSVSDLKNYNEVLKERERAEKNLLIKLSRIVAMSFCEPRS